MLPIELIQKIFCLSQNPNVLVASSTVARNLAQPHVQLEYLKRKLSKTRSESRFCWQLVQECIHYTLADALRIALHQMHSHKIQFSKKDRHSSLLASAVECGFAEIVTILLEFGEDPEENDGEAIEKAAMLDRVDLLKLFKRFGADLHVNDEGALREASMAGAATAVRYLLEEGADIHACDDEALVLAVENRHLDVAQILVEYGADIHAEDEDPLVVSCREGYGEMVEFLFSEGANPKANRCEPLRVAARHGHLHIVKMLVEHQVMPYHAFERAFIEACAYGQQHIASFLYSRRKLKKSTLDEAGDMCGSRAFVASIIRSHEEKS